jgi:hypothetical protein
MEWSKRHDREGVRLCQATAGQYSTGHDGNAKGVDMNKQAYSYSVLRYVHDVTTGEFVNVGLALYCPAMHYANAACRTTSKRLTPLFPSLDSSVFRALMRKVQTREPCTMIITNWRCASMSVMELAVSYSAG